MPGLGMDCLDLAASLTVVAAEGQKCRGMPPLHLYVQQQLVLTQGGQERVSLMVPALRLHPPAGRH